MLVLISAIRWIEFSSNVSDEYICIIANNHGRPIRSRVGLAESEIAEKMREEDASTKRGERKI